MQLTRQVWLIAPILLCGCAHQFTKPDALCNEIARFANASADYDQHSIELTTDWGNRFSADKTSIGSRHCTHGGYAPGSLLCDYLMANSSAEFPESNFSRVQACLWPGTRGGPPSTDYENLVVEAWTWEAPGVDDEVRVGVAFSSGQGKSAPSLRIMVHRGRSR
jgi:hypothetical protein